MTCPPGKTWYVEARVGRENHSGECVRFIDDRRHLGEGYDNRPVEDVIAELRAALAAREAELATLRARLAEAERERDEARASLVTIDGLRADIERRVESMAEQRDAALSDVARLTRERDEARGKALEAAVLAADNDLYGTMSHIVAIAEGKPPREPCQQRAAAVLRCLGALAAKGGA